MGFHDVWGRILRYVVLRVKGHCGAVGRPGEEREQSVNGAKNEKEHVSK